jgi:hypothetical protein
MVRYKSNDIIPVICELKYEASHVKTRLPLLALAFAAFGIGTTEFVIMGLLPEVAADLHVSIGFPVRNARKAIV